MLFNSLVFLFLFLPVTYVVFWTMRTSQSRYVWLAVTGYVFYGYWDARFCLLMAFSTIVSYLAGLGFLKAATDRTRMWLLVLPITVDLCLLAFFKYANFALENVSTILRFGGYSVDIPFFQVVLPVGISFYTFHTITYIVDCYRGTIRPTRNPFEFAAYVSLFSQLVAGPIVRFRQIEEDLEALGEAHRTRWLARGIAWFLVGMLEKILVADTLAAWVDPAFAKFETLSTIGAWLAVLGYTFQLYFDFCGYSDMAVGLGYMFGIRIPVNFNSPYKAVDPSDFWRRWHISLSTCLRDYLYIPLGGNRSGAWAANRNLLLTMLIGGLWHGAQWTFVIWGFYHGMLLIGHRAVAGSWQVVPRLVRQLTMLVLVCIGWVFFRAESLPAANLLIHRMFVPTAGSPLAEWVPFLPVLGLAALWSMSGPNCHDLFENYEWRIWHGPVFAILFGMCIALILGGGNSPFLYFQF